MINTFNFVSILEINFLIKIMQTQLLLSSKRETFRTSIRKEKQQDILNYKRSFSIFPNLKSTDNIDNNKQSENINDYMQTLQTFFENESISINEIKTILKKMKTDIEVGINIDGDFTIFFFFFSKYASYLQDNEDIIILVVQIIELLITRNKLLTFKTADFLLGILQNFKKHSSVLFSLFYCFGHLATETSIRDFLIKKDIILEIFVCLGGAQCPQYRIIKPLSYLIYNIVTIKPYVDRSLLKYLIPICKQFLIVDEKEIIICNLLCLSCILDDDQKLITEVLSDSNFEILNVFHELIQTSSFELLNTILKVIYKFSLCEPDSTFMLAEKRIISLLIEKLEKMGQHYIRGADNKAEMKNIIKDIYFIFSNFLDGDQRHLTYCMNNQFFNFSKANYYYFDYQVRMEIIYCFSNAIYFIQDINTMEKFLNDYKIFDFLCFEILEFRGNAEVELAILKAINLLAIHLERDYLEKCKLEPILNEMSQSSSKMNSELAETMLNNFF